MRQSQEGLIEQDNSKLQIKAEYRYTLLDLEQKSIESFDKTVLYLSGGALGLSMAFLQNIIVSAAAVQVGYLIVAWVCWAFSLVFTLLSFWLSAAAMRKAIKQTDDNLLGMERPGGWWDRATRATTLLGGISFILGVGAMIFFVKNNL